MSFVNTLSKRSLCLSEISHQSPDSLVGCLYIELWRSSDYWVAISNFSSITSFLVQHHKWQENVHFDKLSNNIGINVLTNINIICINTICLKSAVLICYHFWEGVAYRDCLYILIGIEGLVFFSRMNVKHEVQYMYLLLYSITTSSFSYKIFWRQQTWKWGGWPKRGRGWRKYSEGCTKGKCTDNIRVVKI